MNTKRILRVGSFALLIGCVPMRAQLVENGSTLTATTSTLSAVFQNADLTQLVNSVTGESYLKPKGAGGLMNLTMLNPTGETLTFSQWTIGRNASSQNVATISFQDSVRYGTFTVAIDPQTQELVITLAGGSHVPGVRALNWGVEGIDVSSGRVILPSQGGNYVDAKHLPSVSLQYPVSWASQLALFEGPHGGFTVYSTDRSFQFKDLQLIPSPNSTANLQIGTEAVAPWTTAQSVPSTEWRMNVFAGDWRVGAAQYKKWSSSAWPNAVPSGNTSWIRNIQSVFTVENLSDPNFLNTLVTLVDPKKTLLHIPYWTTSTPGTNYPDYTPSSLLKPFIDQAHGLGFHVELYFNAIGVDPANSAFAQLRQYQMRTPDTLQPIGWQWSSTASPQTEAFINPAASAWRTLLLNRIQTVVSAVHPDAIHLDALPNLVNDGNGLIDGMSSEQGLVQMLQTARTNFPDLVFGTEGMAESAAPYCWTAQSWPVNMGMLPGHPITTFLQGDQVSFHGHLAQPNPGEPGFLKWMEQYETQGVLPLLHSDAVYRATELAFARTFAQVQQWQAHGYSPDWTGDWSSALFRYSSADGATAALSDDGTLKTLTGISGILYQRAHDVNQIQTSRYIDKWPAFDNTTIYGLDPALQYWLDALPRPTELSHVTALPTNVKLGVNTSVTSSSASIALVPVAQESFDFLANFTQASLGTTSNGTDGPPCPACPIILNQDAVGGVIQPSIFEHPPATGSQSYIDFTVPIPTGNNVLFQFSAGIDDAATRTDPVYFSVAINGQQIWKEAVSKGSWQARSVSLAAWAGQNVHLRLITDAGTPGNAFAWACWSTVQLSTTATLSLPVNIALPTQMTQFSGTGTLQNSSNSLSVGNSSVPQNFVVFLNSGTSMNVNQSLIGASNLLFTAEPGGTPIAANPTYSQPVITNGSSGGIVKSSVLAVSPANIGRTIVAWNVRLPANEGVQLSFSAGLADGQVAPASGIALSILVNGSRNLVAVNRKTRLG